MNDLIKALMGTSGHELLAYGGTAIIGMIVAFLLSRPMELRHLLTTQMILIPTLLVGTYSVFPKNYGYVQTGDLGGFLIYLCPGMILAVALAPSIAYYFGMGITSIIDPHDWEPGEEEIALRPIHRLIADDNFTEALAMMEELMEDHSVTYEAGVLHAKLLYHFGKKQEAKRSLLSSLRLSKSAGQQVVVMEGLRLLEAV